MSMQFKNITLNEVLIEFRTIGKVTRVSAIDPITNTEVVTVGDTSRGRKELARVAEQKLRYVLSRNVDKTSG